MHVSRITACPARMQSAPRKATAVSHSMMCSLLKSGRHGRALCQVSVAEFCGRKSLQQLWWQQLHMHRSLAVQPARRIPQSVAGTHNNKAHSLKRPTMGRSNTFCTNIVMPCLAFLQCSGARP